VREAAGGLETHLVFELDRSGRSDERWFVVDVDRAFWIDYVAEVEAGYEAAVLTGKNRSEAKQARRQLEAPSAVLVLCHGDVFRLADKRFPIV
jgi:hypothetical protein